MQFLVDSKAHRLLHKSPGELLCVQAPPYVTRPPRTQVVYAAFEEVCNSNDDLLLFRNTGAPRFHSVHRSARLGLIGAPPCTRQAWSARSLSARTWPSSPNNTASRPRSRPPPRCALFLVPQQPHKRLCAALHPCSAMCVVLPRLTSLEAVDDSCRPSTRPSSRLCRPPLSSPTSTTTTSPIPPAACGLPAPPAATRPRLPPRELVPSPLSQALTVVILRPASGRWSWMASSEVSAAPASASPAS